MYTIIYLSAVPEQVAKHTGLAIDELEQLVGRYRPHSSRAGQLRGELRLYPGGQLEIWKHFPRKKLWSNYE